MSTYHITMDDERIEVKPEVLVGMYSSIDIKARQLAPQNVKRELIISQDGRIKNRFHLQVSNRMAPHLISAIQQHVDSESGIGVKSYFYKLQEQIMAQLLGPQEQMTAFNIRYEGKLW
jgi:hypothetical protein